MSAERVMTSILTEASSYLRASPGGDANTEPAEPPHADANSSSKDDSAPSESKGFRDRSGSKGGREPSVKAIMKEGSKRIASANAMSIDRLGWSDAIYEDDDETVHQPPETDGVNTESPLRVLARDLQSELPSQP
jgi:hypothetical protein